MGVGPTRVVPYAFYRHISSKTCGAWRSGRGEFCGLLESGWRGSSWKFHGFWRFAGRSLAGATAGLLGLRRRLLSASPLFPGDLADRGPRGSATSPIGDLADRRPGGSLAGATAGLLGLRRRLSLRQPSLSWRPRGSGTSRIGDLADRRPCGSATSREPGGRYRWAFRAAVAPFSPPALSFLATSRIGDLADRRPRRSATLRIGDLAGAWRALPLDF